MIPRESAASPPTVSAAFMSADSGGVEVALLDLAGVIVSVNQAWVDFCVANDGDPSLAGVGVSYLAACDASADDPAASRVGAAIRRALRGGLPAPVQVEVPCDAPDAERQFDVCVASRFSDDGSCIGAIVTLSRTVGSGPAVPLSTRPVPRPVVTPDPEDPSSAGELSQLRPDDAVPLLEATPDGLVVVGASGRITYVNRALESMSGYRREDLVGRPVEVLVPEVARAGHRTLHADYLTAPRPRLMGQGEPLQLLRRDGSLLPVEISLGPSTVDGHRVVLAAVRDIRERRELEERVRLVADLLDVISDGVAVLDATTGERVYVNRSALELPDHTRDQPAAVGVGVAAASEEAARLQAAITAVVAGDAGEATLDTWVRQRDGAGLPFEVRITYRPGAPGAEGQGHVILVSRDISDRLAAQDRVRISEESFRAAFEHAPIGMAVTRVGPDGTRRIVRANPTIESMLGVPPGDLVGRDFAEFTFPDDEDTDRHAATRIAAGTLERYERHKRYRRADGTTVWVDLRATMVDFPDLPGTTTLDHILDVTSRHEAEQLRTQRAAIAQSVADVTTLVLAGDCLPLVYQQVADEVARVFDAANVTVGFFDARTGQFEVAAAVGPVSTAMMRGDLPVSPLFVERLLRQDRTVFPDPPPDVDERIQAQLGPGAACRFGAPPSNTGPARAEQAGTGLLTIARPPGKSPFTEVEVELLAGLANQLALAIELGNARTGQERLTLLEERQRIARDLHDHVIQDLFAVGMQLNTHALRQPDHTVAAFESGLIDQVDHAIRRLRGSVFELGGSASLVSLSQAVRTITGESARVLGHGPTLTLTGPVDDLAPPIATEVLAVLREALSNVARHSHAATTAVTLDVHRNGVTLTVEDDGVGITADTISGSGLANIRARAALLHGQATITPRNPDGTLLRWTAPTGHSPDDPRPGAEEERR